MILQSIARLSAGIALAIVLTGCGARGPSFQATDLTGASFGRDFELTAPDGKPRRLADFRGKAVVMFFGYTQCPDVCPTTLAALAEAMKRLGPDADRVQVVFITVDPRHDKPNVLAKYVRAFHEDFLGLYGDKQEVARAAAEFKVEAGEHHSTPVFLLDPGGHLRLVVRAETTAESIAGDIRLLLKTSGRT